MTDSQLEAEALKALEDVECPFADGDALRKDYGEPLPFGLMMHKPFLHAHYVHFISLSPFCMIATADADGAPVVSPKGDYPGFVRVIDEKTLVFPDRPGNDQVHSLCNILANPKVQLIFMVPGVNETVRVSGLAKISRDPDLMEKARYRDKLPTSVVVVKVTDAYMHCGKALIRSKLWDEDAKVAKGTVPSIAKITWDLQNGKDIPMPLDEFEAFAPVHYERTLY